MTRLRIVPGALTPAVLTPPPSKSDAHRALVLSWLLGDHHGPAGLDVRWPRTPRDVRVLARGLAALEKAADAPVEIDCADAGAPFRILVTQAAIRCGARVRFTGTARLGERPHGPLFEALQETLGPAGLRLSAGRPWPLEIEGACREAVAPTFRVAAVQSSQFATSLLLGAAAMHLRDGRPWRVELTGGRASLGYLALTVDWLRAYGFDAREAQSAPMIAGWSAPTAVPAVPGDWSSLAYLLLVAWRSGGRVARVDLHAAHPDRAVIGVLERVGLTVEVAPDGTARVSGRPMRGLTASGDAAPDLLPTLAALACVLPAPSVLGSTTVLRLKESDRLDGIRALVAAAGGVTALEGERLRIEPPARVADPLVVDSRGDHRLAMSAAVLSVLSGRDLLLEDPECVEKSFPGFWEVLASAGVRTAVV